MTSGKQTDDEPSSSADDDSWLHALPTGLLLLVLMYLDAYSIEEFAVACRANLAVTRMPHVWHPRCLALWGNSLLPSNPRREFWVRGRLRHDGIYYCRCKYIRMIRDIGNLDKPFQQIRNPKEPRPTVVEVLFFRYLYFYKGTNRALILRTSADWPVARRAFGSVLPGLAPLACPVSDSPPSEAAGGEVSKVASDILLGTYDRATRELLVVSNEDVSPTLRTSNRLRLVLAPPPREERHRAPHVLDCIEFVTMPTNGDNVGVESPVELNGRGFVFKRLPELAHLVG